MGIADGEATPALSDAEKNQRAADQIKKILARSARLQRQMLKNVKRLISNAPGDKATIMALLGTDETEANTMVNSMKTFANTHKKAGDEDIDV
jgi:hypothetical protein